MASVSVQILAVTRGKIWPTVDGWEQRHNVKTLSCSKQTKGKKRSVLKRVQCKRSTFNTHGTKENVNLFFYPGGSVSPPTIEKVGFESRAYCWVFTSRVFIIHLHIHLPVYADKDSRITSQVDEHLQLELEQYYWEDNINMVNMPVHQSPMPFTIITGYWTAVVDCKTTKYWSIITVHCDSCCMKHPDLHGSLDVQLKW